MGKTVPSYRMALEDEIGRWKNFRNTLPDEEDKQAFDVLMEKTGRNAGEENVEKKCALSDKTAHFMKESFRKKLFENYYLVPCNLWILLNLRVLLKKEKVDN